MADESDSDMEKTEEPTQHRIDEFRKRGEVASSKELTSVLVLSASVLTLALSSAFIFETMFEFIEWLYTVDLTKALENISSMSATDAIKGGDARVSWNLGNNRRGPTRARINVTTPGEAITDVVRQYPLTAQMLSTLK